MTDNGVTTWDVCEAAGISYRQADHWARQGHYRSVVDNPGSGHTRLIPYEEVPVIRLAARLNRGGMRPVAAFKGARDLLAGRPLDIDGIRLRADRSAL